MELFEKMASLRGDDPKFNYLWNKMIDASDACNYTIMIDGPWGFEYHIGADQIEEARGTARAFVKTNPLAERYEIWRNGSHMRVEACDLVPPSDDDRCLQAIGWPNASEAAA